LYIYIGSRLAARARFARVRWRRLDAFGISPRVSRGNLGILVFELVEDVVPSLMFMKLVINIMSDDIRDVCEHLVSERVPDVDPSMIFKKFM
jgi:hypothetical protein